MSSPSPSHHRHHRGHIGSRVFSRSAEVWFEGHVAQLMEFNIGDHTALKLAEADTRREAPRRRAMSQAGRAKMAGQPWNVSPARRESTLLPLVVGAQRNKDTATPDTADETMNRRLIKRKQRESRAAGKKASRKKESR